MRLNPVKAIFLSSINLSSTSNEFNHTNASTSPVSSICVVKFIGSEWKQHVFCRMNLSAGVGPRANPDDRHRHPGVGCEGCGCAFWVSGRGLRVQG